MSEFIIKCFLFILPEYKPNMVPVLKHRQLDIYVESGHGGIATDVATMQPRSNPIYFLI